MLRGRAKALIQRRNEVSVHSPEPSSLRAVPSHYFSRIPLERRIRRVLVGWKIRNGCWHARAACEYHPADDVHPVVPFAAPSCRRKARLFFVRFFRQAETWCVVISHSTE